MLELLLDLARRAPLCPADEVADRDMRRYLDEHMDLIARQAEVYVPDPGAVREVRDTGGVWYGNDARPFRTKAQKVKERAEKARRKRARDKRKAAKAAKRT